MNIIKVNHSGRFINLFSALSDIVLKDSSSKVMQYNNTGYFIVSGDRLYDSEGRFDFTFDGGLWNKGFLKKSSCLF